MKWLRNALDVDALCVLRARDADTERTGKILQYVAFGDWTDDSEGPSVRFHGGTPYTGRLDNTPVMRFNIYGDCKITPSMWMDVHNCPNAFDEEYLSRIRIFIQTNLPILYLVYERHLDKTDALAYFEGRMDWKSMISSVYRIPDELYNGLLCCKNNAQLHTFCVSGEIYGKRDLEYGRPLLCERLRTSCLRAFEIEWQENGFTITQYNGNSPVVWLPEYIDAIGTEAFSGHSEIRKLILPNVVQTIDTGAFSDCSGLETLIIPASVRNIASEAFARCASLRSVYIENASKYSQYLWEDAFCDCVNLEEIHLPESVFVDGHPFENSPRLHIVCTADSNAEQYAREYGIPYTTTY